MLIGEFIVAVLLAVCKWAGVPLWLTYGSLPYLTFAVVFYSAFEACRRLLSVYDIRLHGAHPHDEQKHRHRR